MKYRTPRELSFSGNIAQNQKDWYQQFKIYLIASNKNEENNDVLKTNILLNLLGLQGVKTYNNFKKKEQSTFNNVLEAFRQY